MCMVMYGLPAADDYGTCILCGHESIGRSRNQGMGMVVIESQHKNRSDSIFGGICQKVSQGYTRSLAIVSHIG